jgi:penicillin-binding protein 2
VRRRVLAWCACIRVAADGVLVARMYYLQVVQYEHHATLSENNRVHVQPIPPTRGLIYDRNGLIIADNRPSFSLTVTRERAGTGRNARCTDVEVLELTPEEERACSKSACCRDAGRSSRCRSCSS